MGLIGNTELIAHGESSKISDYCFGMKEWKWFHEEIVSYS